MVAHSLTKTGHLSHIRPLDPSRDLPQLVDLIQCAFGDDLALTGSHMIQDMRQMIQWGPLLGVAHSVLRFFTGYVWVEDGVVVGNVSLNPTAQTDVLLLSNVAVYPEYRGKGIAGALVDAAILRARQIGSKRILLQVRDDNEVAQAIYEHRGFMRYDTQHELNLRPSRWPIMVRPPDAAIRPVRVGDGLRLASLARASTPAEVQARTPIKTRDYARGLGWILGRGFQLAFNGRERIEFVADSEHWMVGHVSLTTHLWTSPYQLAINVLPGHRGLTERQLMQALFYRAQRGHKAALRANVSTTHPEAIQAMHELGFASLRVLEQMSLELA